MKKHLIAAAVAGVLAVPAMAQVTVSGRIDTSVGSASDAADEKTTRVTHNVLTSNQITFSGSEDLGGGLKANFTIHTGFNSDANSTFSFGDRGMQVGVSGGFGAIDIGKTTGTMLNSTTASGVTGNIGNLSTLVARPNNMISYTTPNMSGVTLRVIYSAGDETDPNTNTQTEYSAQYSAGPLLARVAYATYTDYSSAAVTASTAGDIYGNARAVAAAGATTDEKITETGAQFDYDLGMAKLNVRYQKRTYDDAGNAGSEFNQYGVGVAVPLGSGLTASLDYAVNNSETDDNDAKLMSATLVKSLSKRTNVYFAYANVNPEDATEETSTLAAVGVRHSF